MPSREEVLFFGAGPARLPTDVLEQAAISLVNHENTGIGLVEHPHRSKLAKDIVTGARDGVASFLDVPTDEYNVLILPAGGTGQFAGTVYNLVGAWVLRERAALVASGLPDDDSRDGPLVAALREKVARELRLDYIITGNWSLKAYQEAARLLGPEYVNVAADARQVPGADGKFGAIPDESTWKLSPNAALVYFCDNETVDGVEFPRFPALLEPAAAKTTAPVVADMSSNILSRPVAARSYGVFFFGAQKNLGTPGITVAVVKRSLLPQPSPALVRALGLPVCPIVLSYPDVAKAECLYNTASIFDIYVAGQVLQKLHTTFPQDKAAGQAEVAGKKAKMIYDAVEAYPAVYRLRPAPGARSRMNIVFRVISSDDDEKAFLKESTALGMVGLGGHRSIGGIRVSNYNSISVQEIETLAAFIHAFAKKVKTD